MHDIAEFLGARDPFSGLDEAALDALATRVEVEYFTAGATIVPPAARSERLVRVVRRGAVELVDDERLLDLVGEGEMFGYPSMRDGLTAGLHARAHEDTLCYALPAEAVEPLLARSSGLRALAGSRLSPVGGDPRDAGISGAEIAHRTAGSLIRGAPLICEPDVSLRDAARIMGDRGVSSVLVRSGEDELGIVTDHDLREHVIAGGRDAEAPLRSVMSTPVISAGEEATGAEVMLAMLDHGVRHLAVLDGGGRPLGVLAPIDLVAAEASTPFLLRRSIARARDPERLREAAMVLPPTVTAMHRSGIPATQVSQVIAIASDALTRRAIELSIADRGPPPVEFAWVSLGSHGRREAVLSSDVDSGMSWRDPAEDDASGFPAGADPDGVRRYMRSVADDVGNCLEVVGWRLDPHGVTASGDFTASSVGEWRAAIDDWLARPHEDGVVIAVSITLDGRIVEGPAELNPKALLYEPADRSRLARLLLGAASRPATGFFRNIVVEHTGEHRGTFDIKRSALLPVIELARYAAVQAGISATSTIARLRAAAEREAIEPEQARALEQAYELFAELRLSHQVRQLGDGVDRPDNHLDPKSLDPLARRYLRDSFREVAAIQRSLASELDRGRGRI